MLQKRSSIIEITDKFEWKWKLRVTAVRHREREREREVTDADLHVGWLYVHQ